MNDTIQTIMQRYSCRTFTDRMPSDADLQRIAEAGIAAPSGMNRQLWRVVVVKDRALIREMETEGMAALATRDKAQYERILARGGHLFYEAPCMIVIPIAEGQPAEAVWCDCGIVAENLALAATSLGIGNVICGLARNSFLGTKAADFKRRLGFPAGYGFGLAILLGYASRPGTPHTPDKEKIVMIG